MIPANAAQSAIALVEQLEAANRRVVAAADTPLAKLVSVSATTLPNGMGATNVGGEMEYVPDASTIEAESRFESVEYESLSKHDHLMDSIISDHVIVTGNHLTFAKNTVRPLIKQYVDEASAVLAGYPDQSTFSPAIVRVDLPEVAMLPGVEGEATKFQDVVYMPLSAALSLPPQPGSAAAALMATGATALDAAISGWVQTRGEEFFGNVYNVVFASSAEGVSATADELFADRLTGTEALTAAFLMARNLLDNIPEGVSSSLADYRIAVGDVVEQTGLRLNTAYEDRKRRIGQEELLISFTKDSVFVFAPVYDSWVAGGGINAILYGNLLLEQPNMSLPAMLQDQQLCMERWELHNRFLTTTLVNRKHDAAKDTLKFCAEKLVSENIQQCYGELIQGQELTLNTNEIRQALDAAFVYIDELDHETIKDLWSIGIEVVAGCIFGYSGAAEILRGIERATRDNPGISPNEAALLATIEYVAGYVVDQIDIRDL